MAKSYGKRLAGRLGGLRQKKLPVAEITEAKAIAKRVVDVLQDESQPRKEALRDMNRLTAVLRSATRELNVLQAFWKQQDELEDVAVAQFQESGELLDAATRKLEEADHESRHLETYLANIGYYAAEILTSQEFQDALVDMADKDYQAVQEAFDKIQEARSERPV